MDAERAVLQPDAVDRAAHAAAPAGNARALKGRPRGGRGHIQHAALPERHLAVRPDVAEQRGLRPRAHAAREHGAGDVRADERVHAGRQIGRAAQKRSLCAEQRIRLKRRVRKARGVAPGQQVQHRRVAGHNERFRAAGNPGLCAARLQQAVDLRRNLRLQVGKAARHGRADAPHDVRRNRCLRVARSRRRDAGTGLQIEQLDGKRRRADVDRRAVPPRHRPERFGPHARPGLDLLVPAAVRQRDDGVAQHGDLAGEARPRAALAVIRRGDRALHRHGAFAAAAAPAAGMRHIHAGALQKGAELFLPRKGDARFAAVLNNNQLRHGAHSPNSTMPKYVTVFSPLI